MPTMPPITTPIAIASQPTAPVRTTIPIKAMAMPAIAKRLPRRAVAGEFSSCRP